MADVAAKVVREWRNDLSHPLGPRSLPRLETDGPKKEAEIVFN